MSKVERKRVAVSWAERGFSCDLWVDPPNQRCENFSHATDELVLVVEGTMEFEVAGDSLRLAQGEELLKPAGLSTPPATSARRQLAGSTAIAAVERSAYLNRR